MRSWRGKPGRRRKHEGGCAPDTPGSGRGQRDVWGTALPAVALGAVPPFTVFPNADYQTGGTGLRNQRKGGITINGVPAGAVITKVYLYLVRDHGPVPQAPCSPR